jgi:hypothetical protein
MGIVFYRQGGEGAKVLRAGTMEVFGFGAIWDGRLEFVFSRRRRVKNRESGESLGRQFIILSKMTG